MDRDTALEKIKKCLALAASSNPHEAAVAMRQAQKLMHMHGISEHDVTLADVEEIPLKARSTALATWEAYLANTIAMAFGCQTYRCTRTALTSRLRLQRISEFVFVGVGAAASVSAYAFDVLYRQAQRDRQAHISSQNKRLKQSTKTARGDAFALAWVMAVEKLVEAFSGRPEEAAVLVKYMQTRHAEMGKGKATSRHVSRHVRNDSYIEGARAGKQARLDRAVPTDAAPLQLITPPQVN